MISANFFCPEAANLPKAGPVATPQGRMIPAAKPTGAFDFPSHCLVDACRLKHVSVDIPEFRRPLPPAFPLNDDEVCRNKFDGFLEQFHVP